MTNNITLDARQKELLNQLDALLAADVASKRRLRRFKWRHPILYRRWLKTTEGQQWKLTHDILQDKAQHIIW